MLAALAVGIIGLFGARFAEEAGAGHEVGMVLALLGGAVLVGGHLANIRATRRVAAR